MKAICNGTQTRNDVVQRNLEQYRAVYARTSQQMGVLKAVRVAGILTLNIIPAVVSLPSGVSANAFV